MRKKIAAFLCALMAMTAFTGCSQAEMGYLKMSVDMLKNMKVCDASGSVTVQADFDVMKEFAADLAKSAGATDEQIAQTKEDMSAMTGKKEAKLDYSMLMDMNTMDMSLKLDLTFEGKKYAMGDMYMSMAGGVYVSSETFWGLYQLSREVLDYKADSYVFSADFEKEMKAALDKNKYVRLDSMAEMGLSQEEMQGLLPTNGYSSLYDAVYEFYTAAFKDFTTGTVTEVNGGYQLKVSGEQVAKLFVDVLAYMESNPDTVLSATTDYMLKIMDVMNVPEEEKAAAAEQFKALSESKDEFVSMIGAIKESVATAMNNATVTKVMQSFDYVTTVKKDGEAFVSTENMSITHNGKNVLSLVSSGRTKASTSKVVMPTAGVTIDTVISEVGAVEEKFNPVTGVTALWGEAMGDNAAMLGKERAEVSLFADDSSMTEYVVKDGRVYLPLREICEALGETVEWNNAEKTAYVVKGTEKTAMGGVVENGKSFVMVRDFEKLGYNVEYKNAEGLHEATVAKK